MGDIHILSHDSTPFRDRTEAARILGEHLIDIMDEQPVIIGIPNNGAVTARGIGEVLRAPMDILLIRCLRSPTNPDQTYGTVTETNYIQTDPAVIQNLGITPDQVMRERVHQLREISECAANFRHIRPRAYITGRFIILTDQGAADSTILADAARALAHERPRSILIALPTAPTDTLYELSDVADTILCLQSPTYFKSIQDAYQLLPPVSDREVITILQDEFERISGHRIQPETTPTECTYNPKEIPL